MKTSREPLSSDGLDAQKYKENYIYLGKAVYIKKDIDK